MPFVEMTWRRGGDPDTDEVQQRWPFGTRVRHKETGQEGTVLTITLNSYTIFPDEDEYEVMGWWDAHEKWEEIEDASI